MSNGNIRFVGKSPARVFTTSVDPDANLYAILDCDGPSETLVMSAKNSPVVERGLKVAAAVAAATREEEAGEPTSAMGIELLGNDALRIPPDQEREARTGVRIFASRRKSNPAP